MLSNRLLSGGSAVVLAASLFLGCGSSGAGTEGGTQASRARGEIDETLGSYDGARLGLTQRLLTARFGRSSLSSATLPITSGNAPEFLPADRAGFATYPDVQFTFVGDRVASISVVGTGARTRRGVSIGDPIDRVKSLYHASCWPKRSVGERTFDARCELQSGHGVYLYFGGDPIELISLSTRPFRDNLIGYSG